MHIADVAKWNSDYINPSLFQPFYRLFCEICNVRSEQELVASYSSSFPTAT